VVEKVGDANAPHRERLIALSRLAKAITTSASEHSLIAMNALSETRGLQHVCAFCSSVPHDDVQVLGSGLALFANICFQGYNLVAVEAGLIKLLVTLLAPPVDNASVVSFAAAALSNLCADVNAAAFFEADERAGLLSALAQIVSARHKHTHSPPACLNYNGALHTLRC
jgi:hypothetical protein